ncbi:MAG: response regulator [Candidatus Pacebacteria bacterium]|nr:response regulator [Candidatus Paceibacterota bacterium]
MAINSTVLVIEDDSDLNHYLCEFLNNNGYITESLEQGSAAIETIEQVNPDLILLDLKLPDIDGRALCREIKDIYPQTTVIILTGRADAQDVVKGFKIGADDYITKPFDNEILLARIRARLKENKPNQLMTAANLTVNPQSMEVLRDEKRVDLTQTEYKLLHYLLKNKNQVLSREMILSHVWGYKPDTDSRVVDVYIGYLRKKIDQDFEPNLIHSVRGFGYILQDKSKE